MIATLNDRYLQKIRTLRNVITICAGTGLNGRGQFGVEVALRHHLAPRLATGMTPGVTQGFRLQSQDYFTRGVWLQSPWNAPLFEGVGVNQYVALYDGTVEVDPIDGPILPLLRDYKMPVFEEASIFFPEQADAEAAVAKTNIQLAALARPLNTPPVGNGVTVKSSNPHAAINVLLKRYGGSTFLLAVNDGLPQNQTADADPMDEMSLFCRGSSTCTDATAANGGALRMSPAGGTEATFTLRGFPAHATAIVLGENLRLHDLPVNCPPGGYYACGGDGTPDYFAPAGPNPITYASVTAEGMNRSIPIINGVFRDHFDTSYAVHLYQILFDPNPKAPLVGDVNGDGKVDFKDVQIVKAALGTTAGMPGYDPRADIIRDGVVDYEDLNVVLSAMAGTFRP